MNMNIETQGIALTSALDYWTRRQIAESLGRFDRSIRRIDIHVSEARGPDGGAGVSAGMTVLLKHRSPVRISTVGTDLFAAIALTARRSEQAVERALSKRRRLLRSEHRRWRYGNVVTAPL